MVTETELSLEAELKLDHRAEEIDLNTVGAIRLNKPRYISKELFAYLARRTVAQALLDSITSVPNGLCLRELMSKHDFMNATGHELPILIDEWRQPPSVTSSGHRDGDRIIQRTYDDIHNDIQNNYLRGVYATSRASDNDRKCMTIYGFQNLHPEEEINTESIHLKYGDVKLAGIDDMQSINNRGVIFFQKAYTIRRSDNIRLDFVLKNGVADEGSRKYDKIQVLGMVCEVLGQTYSGPRY